MASHNLMLPDEREKISETFRREGQRNRGEKKKKRLGGKMRSRWRQRVGNGQKVINKIKHEGEKKKQRYG